MRIASVIGARPQFVKAAPVSRLLRQRHEEILIHSGQHYDHGMSRVFFEDLDIPEPDYDLGVGGGGHGKMTGAMLGLLEELFVQTRPDAVMVFGDTNTTLAGALAAAKLGIPVVHIEAGLRSFDRSMPEEINRVAVDHMSTVLFCPTDVAARNLTSEGLTAGISVVGDVMLDTARYVAERESVQDAATARGVSPGAYFLATVHRQATADDESRLAAVVEAFEALDAPVLWPVHPRTRRNLEAFGLMQRVADSDAIVPLDPLPYVETNALLRGARALLTDSGGMQKEAYFFEVPCVTLRDSTEWVETVDLGWNVLVDVSREAIAAAAANPPRGSSHPSVYGDGHSAQLIVDGLDVLS